MGTGMRGMAVAVAAGLIASAVMAVPASASAIPTPADPPPLDTKSGITVDQAISAARRTGQAVEATASASETTTVTASPNGTVTLTQAALPIRTKVDGVWQDLDPRLKPNDDGTWSPRVSLHPLRLSGKKGTGPMAVVGGPRLNAAIYAPMALPEPTVSGATATYHDVLPGVDLQVTARIHGGFSEVFVVRDAAAATKSDLTTITLPLRTAGVAMTADDHGNITGKDTTGRTVLTAPTPKMWDSSTAATARTGGPQRAAGVAARSTAVGPGDGAQTAEIGTAVYPDRIELTPDKTLLSPTAKYPVYIDPTFNWSTTGSSNKGWATVAKQYPSTNYWKSTPDPIGRMQVGNAQSILSRTFLNFAVPTSLLSGARIDSALMKITETRSWSCTASRVNLYAPKATLTSSNATWNYWAGQSLGAVVDSLNTAHGYASCPAAGIAFDVKSAVQANIKADKKMQTFALAAGSESDPNGWKEFLETSPTLSITYNHRPNKPTGLRTSPATSCAAGTTVGEGPVTLYAPVSDPDGGTLGVRFRVWKSGSSSMLMITDPQKLSYSSGGTAVLKLSAAFLKNATPELPGSARFSWQVQVTDHDWESEWSSTCRFVFDRTRPGAPDIEQPAAGTATIGQPITITVNPPSKDTAPTSYLYQLNTGPYGTVAVESDATSISVTPNRYTNTLSVTGLSAGGNVGTTASVVFNANPADTAIDGDLDGDNLTDLIAVGGTHSLAAGLWLTTGKGDGRIGASASNIGARGNGIFLTGSPTDFTGAQAVTGHFAGTGLQDVLVYYPPGPAKNAGGAVILRGNGDGSTLQAQRDGNYRPISAGSFRSEDVNDPHVQTIQSPLQLVNAGANDSAYPDLLGIANKPDNSHFLTYYPNEIGVIGSYNTVIALPNTTPTGAMDWKGWTIATAQTSTGTTMFLWQAGTGKLYLWQNVAYNAETNSLDYTQHLLSGSFHTGQNLALHAADINNDDTADLWTVADGAAATAWLTSNLTDGQGTLTAAPSQKVLTGTHAWLLNDHADDTPDDDTNLPINGNHPAKDSIGTLNLTGNAGWNSGDLFDPNAEFGGTHSLATTRPAINTTADFTVDAWVKGDNAGGTVLAQQGDNNSAFKIYTEAGSWRFVMSSADTAKPAWTYAISPNGTFKPGVWTHLTASYTRSTGVMDLHVNGKDVARAVHPAPWKSAPTGPFRIGACHVAAGGTGICGNLHGHVAEVLTYNQVVITDTGNKNIRDFDGDNKTDFIGRHTDGTLRLYRGNGAGNLKPGYGVMASGWANMSEVFSPGDFDGDGHADVIGRYSDGILRLYPGNGAGGLIGNRKTIATGWSNVSEIFSPGDFNSDGKPDIIGRYNGDLRLYPGDGAGGLTGTYSTIATSWNNMVDVLSPGDFDRDGKADIVGRYSDGKLRLYPGNGTGGLTGTHKVIATDWYNSSLLFSPRDFNGDTHPDLVGRYSDGKLRLYPGNGTGGLTSSHTVIGTGWNVIAHAS